MASLQDSVKRFCSGNHLKLNTDLGQHFLIDQDVLDAIIEAARITNEDQVVEIGPGIGVLTKELLKKTKNVTAIELDTRLIPLLYFYTDPETPKVIQANALHTEMPDTPYKVVANIPYHITSPLLRHIFLPARSERSNRSGGESKVQPTSLTLLIQREVAEKICDTESAGILTILVALFGTPRIVCKVPPSSFLPAPEVDSAVLQIDCYEKPKARRETIEEILKLTKIAFSQKRKMLRNSFATFPGGLELLSALGIDEKRRPETLTVDEWIALAHESEKNQ